MTFIDTFLAEPKALIIAEPWASKICSGQKDWEMRSRNTHFRGLFAIAQKGTGQLIGVADLYDCSAELSDQERRDNEHHHRVDPKAFQTPGFDKYRTAWKLRNMQMFDKPLPYATRNGAVSWIKLTPEEAAEVIALTKALREARTPDQTTHIEPVIAIDVFEPPSLIPNLVSETPAPTAPHPELKPAPNNAAIPPNYAKLLVPIANDGTVFSPQLCNKKGTYQVGPKGEEKKFPNFVEALEHLKKLPTAYWRRPNPKGNWGAVKAKDWVKLADH